MPNNSQNGTALNHPLYQAGTNNPVITWTNASSSPQNNINNIPASPTSTASTTVTSNENKINQVNNLLNQANNLSVRGPTINEAGQSVLPNGQIDDYETPEIPEGTTPIYGQVNGISNRVIGYNMTNPSGQTHPFYLDGSSQTSQEDNQINNLMASMMANTDAQSALAIQNIKQQYDQLRQQQKASNQQAESNVKNALLQAGVTGVGSSYQYAPVSSQGIMSAQINYGLQQIQKLDSQEQIAIAQVQAAAQSQNFQVMQSQLENLYKIKQDKQDAIAAQQKALEDANQKAQEEQYNNSIENAIAQLYSNGTTDPSQILGALNDAGVSVSSDTVAKTLKNISINGGVDNAKAVSDMIIKAAGQGAPQNLLIQASSAKTPAEAARILGTWAGDYWAIQKIRSDLGLEVAGSTPSTIGNVNGYDISSYATDPNHETAIASIVQSLSGVDFNNPVQLDNVINYQAPNSKITGKMIMNAANTYGVDPKMIYAIMVQDSNLGTTGAGAKNNNPGNIGQFDDLTSPVKGYKTLQDGVNAVASWLSNHKATTSTSSFSPAVQHWAEAVNSGDAKITDVPNNLQVQVLAAKSTMVSPKRQALLNEKNKLSDAINEVLSPDYWSEIALQSGVGPTWFTRLGNVFTKAALQKFLGNIGYIIDNQTIQKLIDSKTAGANYGQLSDKDMKILQSSASKLNNWAVRDSKTNKIKYFAIDEKTFKEELNKLQQSLEDTENQGNGMDGWSNIVQNNFTSNNNASNDNYGYQ